MVAFELVDSTVIVPPALGSRSVHKGASRLWPGSNVFAAGPVAVTPSENDKTPFDPTYTE